MDVKPRCNRRAPDWVRGQFRPRIFKGRQEMKRSVIALSLALLASPALALEVGPPFEQLQIDRALPNIEFPAQQGARYEGARYAQAATGSTRTDASVDAEASVESPWANDFHFVAPPQ
jgi:hypothetical protein